MKFPWAQRQCVASPEAEHSHAQAQRARVDAQNLARRVEDVANRLQETRQRNHFAEAVARAIRGV